MSDEKKKILVTRSSMPPYEEFAEMIRPLWDSAWLTNMGELHKSLERKLAEYLKTNHLLLFVNGHSALEMAVQALGLSGEVITTPFSFASTTHAIVRNGCTPVFADIREEDYTLDPDRVEELITEKTTAILPVHVYGNLCQVERLEEIAKKHHLKVLYDAAHAFGVEKNGRGAVTYGDAAMLSFHATKVYHTIEGGAVSFQDPALEQVLKDLKNFGITDEEHVQYVGGNAKMNEFQAAMGLCNLRHVDEEIEKRRKVCERYREHLEGVPGLKLRTSQPGVKENYAYFPVVFDGFKKNRDEVKAALEAEGIGSRKYFYPLINDYECYRDRYSSKDTPVAKYMADRVLTLPLFASLELEDVDRICRIILA